MDKNMTDVKLVSEALRKIIEPLIDQRLASILDSAYFCRIKADEFKKTDNYAGALAYEGMCTGILRGAALALGVSTETMASAYNNFVIELEIAKQEMEDEK